MTCGVPFLNLGKLRSLVLLPLPLLGEIMWQEWWWWFAGVLGPGPEPCRDRWREELQVLCPWGNQLPVTGQEQHLFNTLTETVQGLVGTMPSSSWLHPKSLLSLWLGSFSSFFICPLRCQYNCNELSGSIINLARGLACGISKRRAHILERPI